MSLTVSLVAVLDSLVVYARHRGAALPGIRRHLERDHSGLRRRLPDLDAHDVRAAAAALLGKEAGPRRPRFGARLRPRHCLLRPDASLGAGSAGGDLGGGRADLGADHCALCHCAQGILPRAGHWGCARHFAGGPKHFLYRHGPKAAGAGQNHSHKTRRWPASPPSLAWMASTPPSTAAAS